MSAPVGSSVQGHSSRELQDVEEESETSKECPTSFSGRPEIVRIAISAAMAPPIQAYLVAYNEMLQQENKISNIELSVLPSLRDLRQDIRYDVKTRSGFYAGFIIPPLLMGDLLEQEGLATIPPSTDDETGGDSILGLWNDLLPYYRTQIASLDGKVRGVPLLAGNQALLLYRKDYLDSLNLPTPVTWGEYIRVAAALHNEELGPDGSAIYGSCLGRLTEEICRRQMDQQQNGTCTSLSMTYIGMTLAQMTQVDGSSTGWMFGLDDTSQIGMKPLVNPSLENVLVFMEQQLKFGAPDELQLDSSMNLELFREGKCAMTISVDHPVDLLSMSTVGFAPIPGSHNYLVREGAGNTMIDCTPELCPYSETSELWGTVNRVPFGATDMMVGTMSTLASTAAASAIRDFYSFIIDQDLDHVREREQPLTYSSLKGSRIDGYEEVMLNLTESRNLAATFRVPESFFVWSEIDNQVYDYLVGGEFSPDNRQKVREKVEASWERLIYQHDVRPGSIPISMFYEMSLDVHQPATSPDLYIGKTSRIIGWSLGGLSCFFSLYFASWVWRYQNTKVVRASQSTFLYMICFGTLMMAGCIFLFGVEDDMASISACNRSCMASMWLYSIGYVIIFTPLSAKVWLINRMFRRARNMQRIKLETFDVLVPLLVIGGANLIVLMTWNIKDPVVWVRSPIDDPPTTLDLEDVPTYGYCNSEDYRVYLGLMLGINYVVSLVALVQAYECRKISTDYGESLWIGASLITVVQVWTVGWPLLKLLDDNPRAVFFVKVGVVFLTTMCPLMLIFVPKIRYLREALLDPKSLSGPGPDSMLMSHREASVTSRDSEDSPNKERAPRPSTWDGHILAMTAGVSGKRKKRKEPSGLEGIRIIQTTGRHGEEVEKLQKSLRHAESRHKSLNEKLERLQEKLEHYIIAHHPHQALQGSSSNFILSARAEQVKLTGPQDDARQGHR